MALDCGSDYPHGAPVVLAEQGELLEIIAPCLDEAGDEQPHLEVPPVEAGFDGGALSDSEDKRVETSRQGVAESPERTGLRRSRRCNRGKPPIRLVQL